MVFQVDELIGLRLCGGMGGLPRIPIEFLVIPAGGFIVSRGKVGLPGNCVQGDATFVELHRMGGGSCGGSCEGECVRRAGGVRGGGLGGVGSCGGRGGCGNRCSCGCWRILARGHGYWRCRGRMMRGPGRAGRRGGTRRGPAAASSQQQDE